MDSSARVDDGDVQARVRQGGSLQLQERALRGLLHVQSNGKVVDDDWVIST